MPSYVTRGKNSYIGKTNLSPAYSEEVQQAGSNSVMYGRVVDVILDSTHPRYKQLGGSQALYGVFYQPLFARAVEDLEEGFNTRFAYCKQGALRQIPVRTEIVQLEAGPAGAGVQERDDEGFKTNVFQEKIYWTSIVPIWNHPHLNIYPDTVRYRAGVEEVASLGDTFEENVAIKPVQLSAGDVILEGRHGQSLRFGGTKGTAGSLSDDTNNGYPYTILKNGQADTTSAVSVENIDEDGASIYLVSNHNVPLTEANHKFAAALKPPKLEKDYKGKQIVANSDQIFINARKDNLELAAKQHLSGNAKTVSLDGEDYLGLDATKVYLGAHAQKESDPVLKGQVTVDFLTDVLNSINALLGVMYGTNAEPYVWTGTVKGAAGVAQTNLKACLARINSLKSKKVYTE